MSDNNEIGFAIVGISGRFPGASDVHKFWHNIKAGRTSVSSFSSEELEDSFADQERADPDFVASKPILDDVDLFDSDYFGMSPREADLTDPQQRVFLEICAEALDDAGYDPERYQGAVGVFAGSSLNTYFLRHVCPDRPAVERFTSNFQVGSYSELLGTLNDFIATRVAYKLNLKGPAVSVQSACSTSLLAVAQACESLAALQCDMALAGGVSITFPQKRGYIYQDGGIASRDGTCRPFDIDAAGTVFGSGAGVVAIKRLADAVADRDAIYAVIRGYGINNDGAAKVGFAAPSVGGQAECIAAALAMAGFDAESIGYVECHGTGTPLGDPIEIEGLSQAFAEASTGVVADRYCALGSVKANVGHLDAAAGVTGLIKTALMLHHGILPPQANFAEPNPRLDLAKRGFRVTTELQEWPRGDAPRRAGVSAFGVGGTNVHLCLEESPPTAAEGASQVENAVVLRLSAKTPTALETMRLRLADHLETAVQRGERVGLNELAHTLAAGRRTFDRRWAVAVNSVEGAVRSLREVSSDARSVSLRPGAVFMFPGQGAQYPGMGRRLFESDREFRADVELGAAIVKEHLGVDILAVLFDDRDNDDHAILSTTLAQPALFLVEYALAQRLLRSGIEPKAMIGHSLGELVAAALAGVMSYQDALNLVVHRGRIMQAQAPGAMLSVRLAAGELSAHLPAGVEIASDNSPRLSVASGPFEAVEELERRLERLEIPHRRLHTSHAFHSVMMDPVAIELEKVAAGIALRPPKRRLMSTVTGTWMTAAEATSPAYWARQCREPVSFRAALTTLIDAISQRADCLLVEVGPGRTLSTFAGASSSASKVRAIIPTAPDYAERNDEELTFAQALGDLWANGARLKSDVRPAAGAPRLRLPSYPFERTRHWIARPASAGPEIIVPVASARGDTSPRTVPPQEVRSDRNGPSSVSMESKMSGDEVSKALIKALAAILSDVSGRPLSDQDAATSFISLGFDSLLLGQVAQRVNKSFGVKITFRQLMRDLNSMDALAAMLKTSAPADKLPQVERAVVNPQVAMVEPPTEAAVSKDPPAPAMAGATGVEALLREQLQSMERIFAAQLAVVGKEGRVTAELPVAAVPANSGEAPSPDKALVMPDTGEEGGGRFKMYRPGAGAGAGDLALASEQLAYIENLVRRYNDRTPGSKSRAQASRRVLADPRTASGFNAQWKEMVYPIVCNRSKGAAIWDIDGNEYIDLVNGYGQTMFGHVPSFVAAALHAQLEDGFAIGPQTELAGEVAARISAMTGNERVAFCNTGSEAVMAAIRVARAVTGRQKVVVFSGAYHGQFDEVLIKSCRAGSVPGALPIASGIPAENVGQMIVLPYGHPTSLELVSQMADDLAAVIVEPIQSRHPALQPRDFVASLRELTAKSGTALVFDEVVTGFRVDPGGMQKVFGIKADLATYGKVLGGGMPIGVVAGRAEFMDALDGGFWQYGDDSEPEVAPTFFAGTFVRHPMVLAAARAVLDHIERNKAEIYAPLAQRTGQLVDRINSHLESHGLPTRAETCASWFFVDGLPLGRFAGLLFAELRLQGIHVHEGFPCFLTTAHEAAQCQAIDGAFERAIGAFANAGLIKGELKSITKKSYRTGDDQAQPQRLKPKLVPLTEPQMEVLLAAQMGDAASMAFNESVSVRFEGALVSSALIKAVEEVVRRHEALRGRVVDFTGMLEISPDCVPKVPVIKLDEADGDAELAQWLAKDARTPFDLFNGPLIRASVLCLGPDIHVLVFTAHHIICDGWSMNVLLGDLAAIYNAYRDGRTPALIPAASFAEHAAERPRPSTSTIEFWRTQFADVPVASELPLDRPRPEVKSFLGASLREQLGQDLCGSARELAKRQGITLFTVLFASAQMLFARLCDNERVVLTVPMGGQALLDRQDLVGHCVNFLPVPVTARSAVSFCEHLKHVDGKLNEIFDHQDYTLGSLVRDLDIPRGINRTPLSDIQFNLERVGSRLTFRDVDTRVETNPKAFVNFDIFINMIEMDDDITIEVDFATDLLDRATVSRWLDQLRNVLAQALEQPQIILQELKLEEPVVGELESGRATTLQPSRFDIPLVEMIERNCDRTPDAIAVEYETDVLRYRDLESRSNRIAGLLKAMAPANGARVAVAVQRGLDLPVALVAVAKAGLAYVPVDPSLPLFRIRQMAEAAEVAVFITSGEDCPVAAEMGAPVIDLARDAAQIDAALSVRPEPASPQEVLDSTAYMIFTSGSTGTPKGVEITHRALANFLGSMAVRPGFGADDRIVAVTTVSFDIAVLELLLPLYCGGRTVICGKDRLLEPEGVVRLIETSSATIVQATPTLWRVLLEAGLQPSRPLRALSGGEALPRDVAEKLIAAGFELWNMYGPTETTIWSACGRIVDASRPIVIGEPVANTDLHILSDDGTHAPVGTPGELWIGGLGLAKGYVDQPDLTAAAFPVMSLQDDETVRLYRTGDLAVRLADGGIQLLGRRDQQVKIRGFRIELEEIESVLRTCPEIVDAAIMVENADTADAALVAAFVAKPGMPVSIDSLQQTAQLSLPHYMVPNRFVAVAELPKTANGKLDRKALSATIVRPPIVVSFIEKAEVRDEPAPDVLNKVISVVEAALNRTGIKPGDRVFALGATSLHVFRMAARFSEAKLPIRAQDLMTNPSMSDLARRASVAARAQTSDKKTPSLAEFRRPSSRVRTT
ncbi:non-ribosomal peptide synthetase [Rhodopseudomonas palustris]|uniref:Non-ribosomal peptide synthetase n=1 Tax=Rhodopseudomonas palustris TaxID=1076 RepID=A0A323UK97_RHOPL|nr:non-ribosomal peptide synthetase/type I polyketide synthase [Rhodopseudomonas palustris]PZA12811.1 non-ribosomal peptide synthetase [Rhodopseudomonas palustris]